MSVEELLGQIDDMVDKAWDVPLSGGKCMIEADRLRDIIDDIRANLPGSGCRECSYRRSFGEFGDKFRNTQIARTKIMSPL